MKKRHQTVIDNLAKALDERCGNIAALAREIEPTREYLMKLKSGQIENMRLDTLFAVADGIEVPPEEFFKDVPDLPSTKPLTKQEQSLLDAYRAGGNKAVAQWLTDNI